MKHGAHGASDTQSAQRPRQATPARHSEQGPKKQCRVMWKATRFYTTLFYLFMLVTVFTVAVTPFEMDGKLYLILFLLFVQICAAVWYSASFIPYGREMISGILRRIGICMPCYMVYDAVQEKRKASQPTMWQKATGQNNA